MKTEEVVSKVLDEFNRASELYKSFNSYHEGYAIVKEELDELWEEIRRTHYNRRDADDDFNPNIKEEAIQVCAMVVRFLVDLC